LRGYFQLALATSLGLHAYVARQCCIVDLRLVFTRKKVTPSVILQSAPITSSGACKPECNVLGLFLLNDFDVCFIRSILDISSQKQSCFQYCMYLVRMKRHFTSNDKRFSCNFSQYIYTDSRRLPCAQHDTLQ